MRLFWSAETKRKAKLFRSIAQTIILSAQSKQYPSCEQMLMKQIDQAIDNSEEIFKTWELGHDYESAALDAIYNMTFDMVVSGQYHFYTGMLKPAGVQLKTICVFTLQKAQEKGKISEEEYNEQITALRSGIKNVG